MTAVLEKTPINENQLELALSWLEQGGFVKRVRAQWSHHTVKAALTPRAVDFLRRLEWLADEEERETKAAIAKETWNHEQKS